MNVLASAKSGGGCNALPLGKGAGGVDPDFCWLNGIASGMGAGLVLGPVVLGAVFGVGWEDWVGFVGGLGSGHYITTEF